MKRLPFISLHYITDPYRNVVNFRVIQTLVAINGIWSSHHYQRRMVFMVAQVSSTGTMDAVSDVVSRIGVYVCHCGTNIGGVVDVGQVAEFASRLPNVIVTRHYAYMCSDPGQNLIKEDIQKFDLNRVVVASCSPLMHEITFRNACIEGGINPFYFQMANIREHVSWVHAADPYGATQKAIDLVAAAVSRVSHHNPIDVRKAEVRQSALIVGAGIAGIEAALRIADSGKQVYLVEREPGIGGHMSQLYKTFPTLDCAA